MTFIQHFSSMKNIILVIVTLLFVSCQTKMREKGTVLSKDAAIATIENFFAALATGDTLLLQKSLTEDFYMYEHDEVWQADDLLELMPLTLGRKWSFKDVKFMSEGNLGHISYFNQGIIPNDRNWLESALLVAEGDSLKIKFLHSTKLYLK